MHYVRLFFDDAETHSRLVNFYLKAETEFTTGNSALDAIYPLTRGYVAQQAALSTA